jgi:hypothetical protein
LADPVSRKRPGLGSASTLSLIASSRSGARWILSMMARSSLRTKPVGSARAAARVVVVERHVGGGIIRQGLRQRRLTGLAGAGQQHDAGVGQGPLDARGGEPGIQSRLRPVDVAIPSG